MSLRAAVRGLLTREAGGCDGCRHFIAAPDAVEFALPGLAALASAYASTWGDSGLCGRQDRVVNGRRRCEAFARVR